MLRRHRGSDHGMGFSRHAGALHTHPMNLRPLDRGGIRL